MENLIINGVEYTPVKNKVENEDGFPYVLIRTYSAGVHIGYLEKRNSKEVKLLTARRIWYWKGAASLSQLAQEGVTCPSECKFSVPVDSIELTEAIEIIPITEAAKKSIDDVKFWKS